MFWQSQKVNNDLFTCGLLSFWYDNELLDLYVFNGFQFIVSIILFEHLYLDKTDMQLTSHI